MLGKIEDMLRKLITPKNLAIVLTGLYFFSLIPLLWIGCYNVPSADDFSIGATCRDAWLATHSIWQVLWQAILMAWNDYFHWMGYYTSIFLMSVHPGVFGESVYAVTTWLMLGSVTFGTMYVFRAILVKLLGMDKHICQSITMVMLFVTVQCTVGRNEAFYWYCGAVNYTFLHGLSLFFFGAVISMLFDKSAIKRKLDLVFACLLGFLVGGGNYMTSLNVCIVMATVVGLLLFSKKLKKYKIILIPVAFTFLGFLLSCLAPGNSVRAAGAEGMNPIKAILVSFYYCLDYCLSEWTSWVVLLLVLLCIPLFWKGLEKVKFTFPCPLLFSLFSFGVLSAMITPPLYALSNITAGRLQALIYMMYLLILTLNIGYAVGWFQKKWLSGQALEEDTKFSKNTIWAITIAAAFFVFGSVLCIIPEPHYYTFTSAITDLSNGSAKAYGEAMKERAVILNDVTIQDAVLEELPTQPVLLFYSDIQEDPDYWENKSMAKGYHKNSVVLQKRE